MKKQIASMLFLLVASSSLQVFSEEKEGLWWGDQGNGTYINPILNADYSDPDVIRVGDRYYMICSDFHFIGMQVLESEDMVNWKVISQIYDKLEHPDWNANKRYGAGAWAPALRYHDGKFWMFVCTPHEGLLMSQAESPYGPWTPLHTVCAAERWEDPCPFWDEDGKAYLGRSQWGGGSIVLHGMSPDGKKLLDEGRIVYTGPVAEGTKFLKKDGYYYISIPEGGVSTGWQTILRSKNIYGPYEKKVVLEQGSTAVNGPHQGALVDTPDGQWWFFHFQATEPLGRVVHLQPVYWKDGWPMIGVDMDMNGIGEPVYVWNKPEVNGDPEAHIPQTDDEFTEGKLGLQWQFNHNPDWEHIRISSKEKGLNIYAQQASMLSDARNVMTQKMTGYEGEAETLLDFWEMADGQFAGICCLGSEYRGAGVLAEGGQYYLAVEKNGKLEKVSQLKKGKLSLKLQLDAVNNVHQFYFRSGNREYRTCGEAFSMHSGNWKGARLGLFTYNRKQKAGKVRFDYFKYSILK
jgi:xylan 1,4-beta-xylosidase